MRQLSNTQRKWVKDLDGEEARVLLQQAKQNLQQAIDLDTQGDYRENLAYDQISQALLTAEFLRWLPEEDASVLAHITQFEQYYTTGLASLAELGQTVSRAEKVLEIARVYLEISVLENCDRAETLAPQSLQTFQEFNRRKLEAFAYQLLGEIYIKRANDQQPEALTTAQHYLSESLPETARRLTPTR